MTGSIRSTSNSFTTRLALVFASWTDENIIRIETVQDAFVASSQRIFFLFDFESISQQLLKVPKAPIEVLLGTFGESTGTLQRPHSTGGFFSEAVPLIRARFSLLSIKGTCGREKVSKIFSNAVERSLGSVGPDPAVAPSRLRPYNSAIHAFGIA